MSQSFDRPIAHRGYHDRSRGIIENSASAFEAAVENGFALECDLQLSADNEAIVFHDDTTERLLGRPGLLRELTAAEIGALSLTGSAAGDAPQTFAALLDQIAGRTLMVVEVKDQHDRARNVALAKRAVELVASYTGPLVFKSFHPGIVAALRDAGFKGEIGIITYRYDRPDWDGGIPHLQRLALRHLLHYPFSRFTFISCEQSSLDLPAVRMFRTRGMKVMSWTVRDPHAVSRVREHADQIVFEGFDPDSGLNQ